MQYQRQSETPRRGHSDQELRVARMFERWTDPLTNYAVCFECGKQWELYDETSYPQICANASCRKKYHDIGMYCLPDVILETGGKRAVVFVNGGVHDKKRQKYKDKYQIYRLREYGYKIFILKNEEIDRLRDFNLAALLKTYLDATANQAIYDKMMAGEKEFFN